MRPNVLLITLDQFRGDSLSCAGHPLVRTPNLDALAAEGVRFARHYAQAAPCAPGRAALYTGTYQMNNRVVANGTPLDCRLDNVARVGLRAGYHPVMFGYTDQGADPRRITDPDDPRLRNWEGVLPGFEELLCLDERHGPWLEWLRSLGYDVPTTPTSRWPPSTSARPSTRSPSSSPTTSSTGSTSRTVRGSRTPRTSALIRPTTRPGTTPRCTRPPTARRPLPVPADATRARHRSCGANGRPPADPADVAHLRSQYFGMITEVDHHMGRIWQALRDRGEWENTVIIVTADHGEQLGDQGLVQKRGFFESSYHILGIVRDPRHPQGFGTSSPTSPRTSTSCPRSARPSANPCRCSATACRSRRSSRGERPAAWRTAAHYEWDWRDVLIQMGDHAWPWDRRLERSNLAVLRTDRHAYVQFGDGDWLCFDLAADPTWQTDGHRPCGRAAAGAVDARMAAAAPRPAAHRHAHRAGRAHRPHTRPVPRRA